MDKKAVLKILLEFKKALEKKIHIEQIILFGSYAENRAYEGSDIDVVVISSDFSGKNYWERLDILSDAIYQVFAPIEAVALTPLEYESGENFVAEIAKMGEPVF